MWGNWDAFCIYNVHTNLGKNKKINRKGKRIWGEWPGMKRPIDSGGVSLTPGRKTNIYFTVEGPHVQEKEGGGRGERAA